MGRSQGNVKGVFRVRLRDRVPRNSKTKSLDSSVLLTS